MTDAKKRKPKFKKKVGFKVKKNTRRNKSQSKPLPGANGNNWVGTYSKPKIPILIQRGPMPFAPRFKTRLIYSHTGDITASSLNTVSVYEFNLNSVFDPDRTGVGHQPQQYDQLTGLYNNYIVKACRLDLEFTNPTADGIYVGYNLAGRPNQQALSAVDTVSGQTIDVTRERLNCIMKPFNNSGSQTLKFGIYIPIHSLMGISPKLYSDNPELYGRDIANNPLSQAIVEVCAWSSIGATAITCTYNMRLTYYTEFYDFRNQASS